MSTSRLVPIADPSSTKVFLPQRPEPAPPRSFPLIATVAPVVGSIALWVITGSPYVLVFALLGPVVAIASLGDASLHGRRRLRRERRRFEADAAAARGAIERAHEREAAELAGAHPNVREIERTPARDPERWRGRLDSAVGIVVGTGRIRSELVLEGRPAGPPSASPDLFDDAIEQLCADAAVLSDAPVAVDARSGLGICGPELLAVACARGIVLQLAAMLSPADFELSAGMDGHWSWLLGLPHRCSTAAAVGDMRQFEFRVLADTSRAGDRILVAVAATADELPRDCRLVFRIGAGSSGELLPHPSGVGDGPISPEFVSEEQAVAVATALGVAAAAVGMVRSIAEIPELVSFGSLHPPGMPGENGRESLGSTPVCDAGGPVVLDLVKDGPHALVGGTTGSGKSELLVSWVLAMAACHGPSTVNFLLVDFKGGSSFTAVQQLPHAVGLITDLDARSAHRALTSLRAELRYRERAIADAGVRSIEQLPSRHPLSRLVIVVDEFAAMVQDFPELHELFADVAARGRSLGVHLILCTQRPAGVVRDAVLANCTLRVSLRVNNRADSTAVIGSAVAAELPRSPLGRAFVSLSGGEPQLVQVAIADDEDSVRIAGSWRAEPGRFPPRRPWRDPLPDEVPFDRIEPAEIGLAFGLEDRPEEQRQRSAVYEPARHGSLLVVGGHRAGKSGALAAIAATAGPELVGRIPGDIEGAWDAVNSELAGVRQQPRPRLLLLDDLDILLGRYPEDYAHAFTEMLVQLLREGGGAAVHLVISVRRLSATVQGIAALCDSRLVLRLPNRQEHHLSGGESGAFDPELPPGGAHWHGHRVQIAIVPPAPVTGSSRPEGLSWERSPGWAIVSARPEDLAKRLRAQVGTAGSEVIELAAVPTPTPDDIAVLSPGRPRIVVADTEVWQSHWGLIGSLKTRMPIIFDGCSVADFRVLSRLRQLPPPISPSSGAVWLLTPDGGLGRVVPPWCLP